MPKVSALVAVYNGEAYLARALKSIRAQTFRDFEIVVVDDGSTDGTADVLSRFPGVKFYRQANRGIGATRQRLLELAEGEWVGFCDHDDVWHPEKLARQVSVVEKGVVLIHAGTSLRRDWAQPFGVRELALSLEETGSQDGSLPPSESLFGPKERASSLTPKGSLGHLLPDNLIHTSSAIFRRETALQAGGFPDSSRAEDYEMWFRLAGKGEFLDLPEVLTLKYQREGSASAPDAAWYAAERAVLDRHLPPPYDALAKRKIAIAASLEAECLDREGRHAEARVRHLQAIRGNPGSLGGWRRFLRHFAKRF